MRTQVRRSPIMNVMHKAVEKAAFGLRRDFGEVENLQISKKGPGDFVSAADLKAEKILREELSKARPGYGFLMEESGEVAGTDPFQHRWIIDPLDGTTNFLHSIPHFAISVALTRGDELVAGIIYDPIKDELFSAERGQGAFLNDRRIRVSARRRIADCVCATGIPHARRGDHDMFEGQLRRVMDKSAGIRRFGAAALDLAYVAAGRVDGYWENNLNAWDIAAGLLLVREAGGYISDLDGKQTMLQSGSVVAANDHIHAPLRNAIRPKTGATAGISSQKAP